MEDKLRSELAPLLLFQVWKADPKAFASQVNSPELLQRVWAAFARTHGRAAIMRVIASELERLTIVLDLISQPVDDLSPQEEELSRLSASSASLLTQLCGRFDLLNPDDGS